MKLALKKYFRYAFLLSALAGSALAQAADLNFDGVNAVANCSRSGTTYTCTAFGVNNVFISAGVTVSLGSAIQFDYNQKLSMRSGSVLTVAGNLDIGNIQTSYLDVTGGQINTTGRFNVGQQVQTLAVNVKAASMVLGSGSALNLTGTLVSDGAVDIASHATITGPISGSAITTNSPVVLKGDVTATASFTLASGSSLTGNLIAPVTNILPANTSVKGNITARTSLTIGSGNTVTGAVDAGNVTLQSSFATITGNALVDYITLEYGGQVLQNISCRAGPCSCVTDNSGYQYASPAIKAPTCVPPPAAGPHHFEVTHSGSALTCQPQTVNVKACANSACTSLYTGAANLTLAPGGNAMTFSNGASNNATVQNTDANTVTLSALASATSATTAGLTCINTSNSGTAGSGAPYCSMVFSDTGLTLSAPNHISEEGTVLTISAKTASANKQSCVPLFANMNKTLSFGCAYVNPAPAAASQSQYVRVGAAAETVPAAGAGACADINGSAVSLSFDAYGTAKAVMKYADVGQIIVKAKFVSPTAPTVTVTGVSDSVTVVPASVTFDKVWNPGLVPNVEPSANTLAGAIFVRAGQVFSATVSARNNAGAVTPNFGKETTAETVKVSATLQLPATGNNPALGGNSFVFTNGVATASNLSWPEAGIIGLNAIPANLTTYYLGASSAPQTKGSRSNIGRFIPDHFNTAISAATGGVPMVCLPGSDPTCPAATFVYSDQNFGLGVTALSVQNTVTENYDSQVASNNLAKDITLTAWNAAGDTANQNPPANIVGNSMATPSFLAPSFTKGYATLSAAYHLGGTAAGAARKAPYATPTLVFFRAADSDGVSSLRAPASASVEGSLTVVSGRYVLPNKYGSELLPMLLALQVQYWSGGGYWVDNLYDFASSFSSANAIWSACQKYLADSSQANGCKTLLNISNRGQPAVILPDKYGKVYFNIRAPGSGNSGNASLGFQRVLNTGSWYLPGSVSRLTFGVYSGGPVIYLREIY